MNYILHVAARQQAVHARAVRKEGLKSGIMETGFGLMCCVIVVAVGDRRICGVNLPTILRLSSIACRSCC
jgi:hypothetical protein